MLEPRFVLRRTLASVAALAPLACGDPNLATAPVNPGPRAFQTSSTLSSTSSTLSSITVVPRSTSVRVGLTATAWITSAGGTLALPTAGLRVTFPAGAVAEPVQVTVSTTSAGRIAYDFSPQGLALSQPVTVEQTLPSGKQWVSDAQSGGVFGTHTALPFSDATGAISPDETYSASLTSSSKAVAFEIRRIAGYQLASGRKK